MIASPGRIVLLAGITVLSFSACGTGYRNVREHPVSGGPCRALAVVVLEDGDLLGWIDASGDLCLARAETDLLARIQDIQISPDGASAAIVSVGEGHPYLTVYRLNELVAGGGRDGERLSAEATLDPYPLTVEDVRWAGPDDIEFRSAIDFTCFDRESRRGGYDESRDKPPVRTWRWRLVGDSITAAP